MSNRRELVIVKELDELKELECRLQYRWKNLARAGEKVRGAFLSSLDELKTRTQRLERLLDPTLPPINELERAA